MNFGDFTDGGNPASADYIAGYASGGAAGSDRRWLRSTFANPPSDDGLALGTPLLQWSDIRIASGGIINWNSADTLTHSSGALSFSGNFGIGATPSVKLEIKAESTATENFTDVPSTVKIYKGSVGTPATDIVPVFGISRYEAITSDTQSAANAPIRVNLESHNDSSGGFSASTVDINLNAQSNAAVFLARQYGSGDCLSVWAQAEQNSSTPFRRFFQVPFTIGISYEIASAGTTDFTLIGAANNNVGTTFVATGVGTGTGKAYQAPVAATSLVDGVLVKIATAGTTDFTLIGSPDNNVGTIFYSTGAGTGSGTVIQMTAFNTWPVFSIGYLSSGSYATGAAIEAGLVNNTGVDFTWDGSKGAFSFALAGYVVSAYDAVADGDLQASAYMLRSADPLGDDPQFDVGLGAHPYSVKTNFLRDDSQSITSYKITDAHTNIIDANTATASGYFLRGPSDSFKVSGAGVVTVADTTASTSTSTGAVIVAGGVGVAKKIFTGGLDFANGTIDTTHGITVGGVAAIKSSSGYFGFYDGGGSTLVLEAGTNASDPTVYFSQTNFTFRAQGGGATMATLNATNMTLSVGLKLMVGTNAIAPLQFQAGTNLSSIIDGAMEFDGQALFFSPDASDRRIIPTVAICRLHGNYTLADSTTLQKIFNATTNGTVTLPAGSYIFEAVVGIDAMSATGGNAALSIVGAGGATVSNLIQVVVGIDGAKATAGAANGASWSVTTDVPAANTSVVTATTATEMAIIWKGSFETTAGTVIPSVDLITGGVTPAVKLGSYFMCWRMGAATDVTQGNWS